MKSIVLRHLAAAALLASFNLGLSSILAAAEPPKVGGQAPDFTLKTPDDQSVRLSDVTTESNVILVLLRGWPGYQCPACDRQVHDFISAAPAIEQAQARVVFVYPGPAKDLKAHAKEFAGWKGQEWPKDFLYALDPDYTMVNAYGLRWDAPGETAYPATFVLDRKGVVRFANISRTHGGRAKAADILTELKRVTQK